MSGAVNVNGQQNVNGPLVVKLGGAAVDQAYEHDELFAALAELHRAHESGVVVVHGGGGAVDRRLERLGLESERRDGIRITPDDHIDEVVAVLAGIVNKQLVGVLQRHSVSAVGLSLADGGTATTFKADGYAFDPGRVGEIRGGDSALISLLLAQDFLPVLSSIGLDEAGHALNVNADDAAAGLACLLKADGLLLLTDVPGVLDGDGQIIAEMMEDHVEAAIQTGVIHGGMIPKVRGAIDAARASGAPVTIASWKDAAAIRRMARGEHVGTRITCTADGPAPDVAVVHRVNEPQSSRHA